MDLRQNSESSDQDIHPSPDHFYRSTACTAGNILKVLNPPLDSVSNLVIILWCDKVQYSLNNILDRKEEEKKIAI